MPPRIAYWTSAFEPHMEAISSEVALLRRRFPGSVAWGLSQRHWMLASWRRGFCLHPTFHLLFRAAVRVLEPAFHLNHIFGSVGDWFYLQGQRRRPTVLTMAAYAEPVSRTLLDRVDRFVVEYPGGAKVLRDLGIDAERIRLIYPPVDLARFTPSPPPEGPFTVLFASSPDEESWLEARGVPLLLETAALRPTMRFRLLWRPWGNSLKRVRAWITDRELKNVELIVGRVTDMAREYREAHVTAVPFTHVDQCKPAPNSLVESLASGRPVLTTPVVGVSDLVREGRAGIAEEAIAQSLANGLDNLRADWASFSSRARELAEQNFAAENFVKAYQQVYKEVLNGSDTDV